MVLQNTPILYTHPVFLVPCVRLVGGVERGVLGFVWENLKKCDSLEDLGIQGRIIPVAVLRI
jgi:hypothetical protein